MSTPTDTPVPQQPQDAPQAPADAPVAAPAAPQAPAVGSIVLHPSYDARQGADRDLRMLVVGVADGGRVHAVTLGWADEYADLGPDDYRLP